MINIDNYLRLDLVDVTLVLISTFLYDWNIGKTIFHPGLIIDVNLPQVNFTPLWYSSICLIEHNSTSPIITKIVINKSIHNTPFNIIISYLNNFYPL